MLLGNYTPLNSNPGRNIGGFSNSFMWMHTSNIMNFYSGEHSVINQTDRSSFNNGYSNQYSWNMSPKSGGLSIYNGIIGYSNISNANLAGGLLAESTITGIGDITIDIVGIGSIISSILASSDFSFNGDIIGSVNMSANLAAQGDLQGTLGALVNILADLNGSGILSGDGLAATFIAANLAGQGDLIGSITGVIEIIAALNGVGLVTSDGTPQWKMIGDLIGSGALTSNIEALGILTALLNGNGQLIGQFGISTGSISSDISAVGDLVTPESIASAVWAAIANDFNSNGSMGEIMNNMGSVADPWDTALPGSYTSGKAGNIIGNMANVIWDKQLEGSITAKELMRLYAAVLAGKSTVINIGGGLATITFKDINDTKVRVTANMNNSDRKTITKDLT